MTAISPYAPIRRQSSILSNASNGGGGVGRMVRRSSSTLMANATTAWFFIRFWRRIMSSRNNDDSSDDYAHESSGARGDGAYLTNIARLVYTNLTIDNNTHHVHATASSTSSRGIESSVLQWLVSIVGGDQSRMGRIIIIVMGYVREVLLRSISAANVLLTGSPVSLCLNDDGSTRFTTDHDNGIINISRLRNEIDDAKATNDEISHAQTIKQDLQQIDKVLSYWFGQASPDGAQKSLWMIASSSVELLDKVDADISNQFRSLLLDLSSNTTTRDENSLDTKMLARWTDNVDVYGWQGKMAAIIVLDQMSRHIHRHDKNHGGNMENCIQFIPNQQQLDNIAYTIAKLLQDQHQKELSTGIIPLPMRIFGIMPLRHASTVEDLTIVQRDVEAAAKLHDEMDRMVRRFRKATNRRMAALQDEARRNGKLGPMEDTNDLNNTDGNLPQFDDEKILECFPFKADMSKARDHIVIKTISAFLCKMNILQMSDARFKSSRKIANSIGNKSQSIATTLSKQDHVPTAIVSLSGGVDSMVIASALAYIRDTEAIQQKTTPDNILRIVAIHIDYANRPESGAEAAYVGRYCEEIGAKFIIRRIDEVTRGVTARDDYERIARQIRFDLYRQCCAEASDGTVKGGIGIMLGHHRGDLRENVLSNAHKGCGPLDLSGITEVSKNDGVNLFRPLLPLEKTYIYDYSHVFGVPYFKDTTPHWSTRGKLRNRLLPLLEEIYGEGSMDHLSSLAEESDDAKALIQQTVMGPFMEQVKRYPMGITFETSPWKECGLFFWKFVLRQVLHSAGLGMFSDKSVESFLDRVRVPNVREGWLQCRKDYAVFLQKDGRVFVFFPSSFPFGNGRKKVQYDNNTTFLGYGTENSMLVGPWVISSEIINTASEEEAKTLLQQKAFQNFASLMTGEVKYCLKVPLVSGTATPHALIRVNGFTKPTRPQAWKGLDLKVESTLPLLGVDQSVLNDDTISQEYERTWALVRVQLLLDIK